MAFLPFLTQSASGNDPIVAMGANRIGAIANTGYSLSGTQKREINPLIRYLRGQGLANNLVFYHDPKYGVNRNLAIYTDDLDNTTYWDKGVNLTANGQVGTSPITGAKAWSYSYTGLGFAYLKGDYSTTAFVVYPNTTYTLSCDIRLTAGTWTGGSRSLYLQCFDSGGVFTANRGGPALMPTADWQRVSVTVTTGASDTFAVFQFPYDVGASATIEVAAPQVEIGATAGNYNARIDSTICKANNLVSNASGDGTFVNGTTANMVVSDTTAGRVLNFDSSLSQGLTTGVTTVYNGYTVVFWVNCSSLSATLVPFRKGGGVKDRLVFETSGAVRFSGVTGGSGTSSTGQVVAGTWAMWTVTASTNATVYKNSTQLVTGATTYSSSSDPLYISNSADIPFFGKIGEVLFFSSVLTSDQITAIYNLQKSRYGL